MHTKILMQSKALGISTLQNNTMSIKIFTNILFLKVIFEHHQQREFSATNYERELFILEL